MGVVTGVDGGQWGWTPGNDACSTYPTANFTQLGLPDPGVDIS
jgi:hypothetical protein